MSKLWLPDHSRTLKGGQVMDDTQCDRHVLIRGLPKAVDEALNVIAAIEGKPKWQVTRDALVAYVSKRRFSKTVGGVAK